MKIQEARVIEVKGQKFYVDYVEVRGSVAKPWVKEVRLLGVKPNAD